MEPLPPRTSPRRLAAAILLAAVLPVCAWSLGACGGGESEEDVEGLLDRAFRQSIASADLKVEAQLTIDGLEGFDRPVRLQAAGPYIDGGRALPKLDIDLKVGVQGAGQTVQFGLLRTGDRAFVKFGGQFYEQPRRQVERANRQLGKGRVGPNASLRDLGLNPRTWIVAARDEGDEKVAGAETDHVSGRLDTRSLFRDLNELVERSAGAIGGAPADVPEPLTSRQIDELAEIVRSPGFDVYVGKADDVIRRLSARFEVRVPERDRERLRGIAGGSLRFSVELRDLGGDQRVEAPASARPIADLTTQLGGLGALEGALGGGPGKARGRKAGPGARGGASTGAGSGSSAGGTDGDAGAEAVRRYSDCLDKADPQDTKVLSRCAELLR